MLKKLLVCALFLMVVTQSSHGASLYSTFEGFDFGYRYMDAGSYEISKIKMEGNHTATPHNFSYKFAHSFGDQSLTEIGADYSFRGGSHWFGGGISSYSDKPFSQFNLIDFDLFYAFRLFQNTVRYTKTRAGDDLPHFTRLYLGVDWSTERILLDGYPLPIIRYEYDGPSFYLILGFPMTYMKVYTGKYQSLELKYVPVMNLYAAYNFGINASNVISLQFEMEHNMYRMSGGNKDLYFDSQTKYYTRYSWVRLMYSLTLADVVKISPYAAMLVDGVQYYGKTFDSENNKRNLDFGYALGINLSVKF